MRKTMLAVLLSLGVALVLSAPALAHDPDDYHGGSLDARQHGYQHGYRDGYEHGRQDRLARTNYDYRSDEYERGDGGYADYMGNHGQFKQGYREGYRQGYDDGFYNRAGRFSEVYGGDYDPDDRDHDSDYSGGAYYQRGYDYRDVAYDTGYRDGVNEGAKDRRSGHSYRPSEHSSWQDADHNLSTVHANPQDYKSRYRQGYERGYQEGYGYDSPGNQAYNSAYNFGYQDGLNDGAKDRRGGHSFRPHEHSDWQDADHGLSTAGINAQDYKNQYRQGYERGYREGYGH